MYQSAGTVGDVDAPVTALVAVPVDAQPTAESEEVTGALLDEALVAFVDWPADRSK